MQKILRKPAIIYMVVSMLAITAVCLTMFRRFEMGGESWGYWYFARVFSETGNFVILDRSPLYVLYLNLFNWMHFPYSVTAEYLVTTGFTMGAMILFFEGYLGIWLAIFAACLWAPFIQVAEPPVQKLALGVSFLAILFRGNKPDRFRLVVSYALLSVAYLFRQTYIILLGLFMVYDIGRAILNGHLKGWRSWRLKFSSDWPLLLVAAFFVYFSVRQSPSSWNNVWFGTTDWFPGNGKTMADGGSSQCFNRTYIEMKYGTYKGHDFYFTNKEAFGGAKSMLGTFQANPKLVLEILLNHLKVLLPVSLTGASVPAVGIKWIDKIIELSIISTLLFGAYRAAKSNHIKILLVASVMMAGVSILDYPKTRYMFPLIPLFVMAASWYGSQISNLLSKFAVSRGFAAKKIIWSIPTFLLICFVSKGNVERWADVRFDQWKILEPDEFSMKTAFPTIAQKAQNCSGIMSLEAIFMGAFLDIPQSKVLDVWEIPPFGKLGDSEYKGLNPSRVDCVFVSQPFATSDGAGTNYGIRYENYIKPYIQQLQSMGAVTYEIPHYGQAIILSHSTPF